MKLMPMGNFYFFSVFIYLKGMDPNIHCTLLFLLQLRSEALNKIVSLTKSDLNLTRSQYIQNEKKNQQLFDNEHKHIDYQTIDVGYACKT